MRFNPGNPQWVNRDRFVLSNGHACVLQYIMLHMLGYALSMEDLKRFRQLDSAYADLCIHPSDSEVGVRVTRSGSPRRARTTSLGLR